ncbi:MAG: hypothetical protein M3220_19655, partial [Chloroflexota bacterium]|nr:hypothetical protein [Chloroflexota bacterium]
MPENLGKIALPIRPIFARLVVVLLAAAALGCRPGEPASQHPSTDSGAMPDETRTTPLVSSLQVESVGDSVRFTLMVTNVGTQPLS